LAKYHLDHLHDLRISTAVVRVHFLRLSELFVFRIHNFYGDIFAMSNNKDSIQFSFLGYYLDCVCYANLRCKPSYTSNTFLIGPTKKWSRWQKLRLTLDLQIVVRPSQKNNYACKTSILDFSKWPPLKTVFSSSIFQLFVNPLWWSRWHKLRLTLDLQIVVRPSQKNNYVCKTAILDFSKWPPLKTVVFLYSSSFLIYDNDLDGKSQVDPRPSNFVRPPKLYMQDFDDLGGKSHFCFGNKWISDTYTAL
jgi:hypothetical protein